MREPQRPALTALYTRLPANVVARIDELTTSTGKPKQQVVTELLEAALPASPKRSGRSGHEGGVLSLDEAARLLRVSDEDVLAAVRDSGLPARRIGSQWRFSRDAVLAWLSTPVQPDRSVGFARPSKGTR